MKKLQKQKIWIGSALLALSLSGAVALAADTMVAGGVEPQTTKGAGAASLQDESTSGKTSSAETFIKHASEGNKSEVALAEIAEQKAQSTEVRQLAQQMRQDHQMAEQQLKPLAESRGISLTEKAGFKHERKLSKLQKLSGAEFDQAYTKEMLRDHQKDVKEYESASRQLQDADLKQYIQTTLPKLRQHLEHARHTALAVGIDQETITSILKQTPGAMGGSEDLEESQGGKSNSSTNRNRLYQ